MKLAVVLVVCLAPFAAHAADAIPERMMELSAIIRDPASSAEQRESARDELRKLMKVPAARAAPRAAIQPFPSVVKPAENPVVKVPPPPVAHIEVVQPPKPLILPQSGAPAVPAPGVAVDPRTGGILHETPGGYINPRTGEFIPR